MKKLLLVVIVMAGAAVYDSMPKSVPAEAKQTPVVVEEAPEPKVEEVKELSLSTSPAKVIQGEPVLVTVEGVASTSSIKTLTFNGQKLAPFISEGKVKALIGLDLRIEPKNYLINV